MAGRRPRVPPSCIPGDADPRAGVCAHRRSASHGRWPSVLRGVVLMAGIGLPEPGRAVVPVVLRAEGVILVAAGVAAAVAPVSYTRVPSEALLDLLEQLHHGTSGPRESHPSLLGRVAVN